MAHNKFLKIVAAVLLSAQLGFWPMFALAQLGGFCGLTPANPCSTYDYNNGSTPGALGAGANATFDTALAGIVAANEACIIAEQAYEKTDSAAQLGFSGLAIIGGDSVLLAQLGAKITAYNGFISCRDGVLKSLTILPAPNVYTSNKKQTLTNQVNQVIASWRTKLEDAQARYNNAKQGFWKTLVFNILIKTSKSVANALVAKLVSKYKVNNYMQYADSLATLMYDNQFIRQNFPDAQGQFMARAILENPIVRYKVPPAAFIAADGALGFDPKALQVDDPLFYSKMAKVGSTVANPYFLHTTNIGGVDQARANALSYAQGQISQGAGLKAPVTCSGTLVQQKQIDARNQAANDRYEDRYALYRNLKEAKELNLPVKDEDLAKATADLDIALKAIQNLPQEVDSPAIKMCEAIVSPASLIDKGIDEAFKSVGTKLGQYDNNNLPSFMNIIADVASQIGSSLIFGGLSGARSAAMINEGRAVSAALDLSTDYLYSNATENLAKGINFSAERDVNFNDAYSLSWDVITEQIKAASFVTINGDGISNSKIDPATGRTVANRLPLSGSAIIHTNVGGSYILTVFDANGRALTAANLTIPAPTSNIQQAYNNLNQTAVLGTYIQKPQLEIRGAATILTPRGPQ
jgi:hypothetical protein